MMFASTLGVMLAMGIILTVLISMTIGYIATVGSTPDYTPKSNTVFKIKLDGTLADNPAENPFSALMGDKENMLSLKDLLETIRIAKQNDKIAGIYIESGLLSSGSASLEAIRRSLIDFKESGKFVVAYADNFTQGNYFLCSVADKVFLNPQGILELTGLASQTLFYKGLMDKVGIEMQIFKVGTYKGAVEPFILDKLSEANREQIQSYISTIWDNIAEGIAESRGISVNDINHYANEGLFFADPVKTVECGFIDELKYKPEVEAYVKELAGQNGEKLRSANLAQMKTLKASPTKNAPEIAVLYAEGETKAQTPGNFYDPRAVRDAVAAEAVRLCREGIDGPLWQRIKKGAYGAKVRGLNSFENLCIGQAQAFFAGSDYLRFADLFAVITREEAQDLIARWVTPERTALAVIRPKGESK